jgi:hypothetical protein
MNLHFIGHKIYNGMSDDKYVADLEILDFESVSMHTYSHITQMYSHGEFEQDIPADLSPPHQDYGSDADGDGYFDSLVMNVSVEVSLSGDYRLLAKLHDSGLTTLIAGKEMGVYLVKGTNVAQISFEGGSLLNSGIDGPYEVGIYLFDIFRNLLQKGSHTTLPYDCDMYEASSGGPAKATISGKVVDEKGNPINGVSVELKEGQSQIFSTQTNETGEFTIPDTEDGDYVLVIDMHGYSAVTKDVTISDGSDVQFPSLILQNESHSGSENPSSWMIVIVILLVLIPIMGIAAFKITRSKGSMKNEKE